MAVAPFLISVSVVLGAIVGSDFLVILLLYLLVTVAYSLALKRLVLVDCLYRQHYTVQRIILCGTAAVSVSISFWLIAFSIFIFLSLALVKRYAELVVMAKKE